MTENVTSNSSKTNVLDSFDGTVIFNILYSIQYVLALVGNSLIVWIVHKDKRLKTTTNYLVVNMAVSDLLASLFAFPIRIVWMNFETRWLIEGDSGAFLCKLSHFIAELSLVVSVSSCFFIAIDRFYAVACPLKKPFELKIKYIIAGTWLFSCCFKSPILYFFSIFKEDGMTICMVPSNITSIFLVYQYSVNILTTGLTAVFVVIIYSVIVYKLYKRKIPGTQNHSTLRRKELQNRNIFKMSVTVVTMFYLSWGSRSVFVILHDLGMLGHLSESELSILIRASFFMLYVSLMCNFFVYLIFNQVYRQNVKAIIGKWCCWTKVNITTSAAYTINKSEHSGETVTQPAGGVEMVENIDVRMQQH